MHPRKLFSVAILIVPALLAAPVGAAQPAAVAQLTYTKVFPKSDPEYTIVSVKESGEAMIDIRSQDDPAHPDPVTLSRANTDRLFALAAALNNFRGRPDWEPKQRVAAMGRKTVVYEKGDQRNEVTFNYSALPDVQRLVDLFEGVARTWYYHERLSRALIYDRLSLLELMRQLEGEFNRGHIAEASLLVPVLRQLVDDPRVIHLAQTKARNLLERIEVGRATISFSRITQSNPGVYLALTVRETGEATYEIRSFEMTAAAQPLMLAPPVVARMFELAGRLEFFRTEPTLGTENAPRANERTTLAYDRGSERHQLVFTATTDPALRELASLAERVLRQQWHRQNLEDSRADPERIGPALNLLEQEIREGRLLDPAELAPILSAIAADARIPAAAQQHASKLASRLGR